jgi:hypothetical protein
MICVKSGTQFYQPLFTKACLWLGKVSCYDKALN